MGVLGQPSVGSARIPALAYAVYQSMFAAITPMLAFGGYAERGRLGPTIIIAFLWATLVYDPVACWTWNPNGWSFLKGCLDFAGGGPVHMTSGTAALATSIWLGKRRGYGTEKLAFRPHNVTHVVLGTVMLWFGWFGFNGGSALGACPSQANDRVGCRILTLALPFVTKSLQLARFGSFHDHQLVCLRGWLDLDVARLAT